MGDYRRLDVWQLATQLALDVYQSSARFPSRERFALTIQVRRASISVSSNIAEGSGRGSPAEIRRFMIIARGSLHELASQLFVARELEYLAQDDWHRLDRKIDKISRMLFALSRAC